eukprot:scaffold40166_cov32-Tisochrysis_lutea.AAC.2
MSPPQQRCRHVKSSLPRDPLSVRTSPLGPPSSRHSSEVSVRASVRGHTGRSAPLARSRASITFLVFWSALLYLESSTLLLYYLFIGAAVRASRTIES